MSRAKHLKELKRLNWAIAMATQGKSRTPQIWPSAARIIATVAIFVFHYLGLLGLPQHSLDTYAILIFCFLTGYLANVSTGGKRIDWVARRYFGVMVPHWLVIIPIIVANQIFHYKSISVASIVVTILGGNLFLSNPLYVITWYVTFVLILYTYAFLESFANANQKIVCMVIGVLIFIFWLRYYDDRMPYYFIVFLAGLRMAPLAARKRNEFTNPSAIAVTNILFAIQIHCYAFFLIHGAVLLVFVTKTPLPPWLAFVVSFFTSAVAAVCLDFIAKPLQAFAASKVIELVSRRHSPVPAAQQE